MNNKNENLTVENENILKNEHIKNNINNELNIDKIKSINNPSPFKQVTYTDFILFKEDFLKTIKELKKEMNTKLEHKFIEYYQLIEETNKKLYNYEKDKNTFIQKLNFLEDKHEILSKISETTNNLKNELNEHILLISNCQKDISKMGFKYDEMIINNLLIPGLIGPMCKFNNFKEYILYYHESIDNFKLDKIPTPDELKSLKKKLEDNIKGFKIFQKNLEETNQTFTKSKIIQTEKKFEAQLDLIKESINSIRSFYLNHEKTYLEKEKNYDESLRKINNIKKEIFEENYKTFEKTKDIIRYTLSRLEKSIIETNNIKKGVLKLSNIFIKQKRAYGDDNLNENKKEVINNFCKMINYLIKDLINNKNNMIKNNNILIKKFGNSKFKNFKSEVINLNANFDSKILGKNNINSNNILNDTNKEYKPSNIFKKRALTNNKIIFNNNFSPKKLNTNNNISYKFKKYNSIREKEINDNINLNNEKNDLNNNNNDSIIFEDENNENNDIKQHFYNFKRKNNEIISKLSIENLDTNISKIDDLKNRTINNYLSFTDRNSIKINNDLPKESSFSTIKKNITSRNSNKMDIKHNLIDNNTSKDKKRLPHTEKKYELNENNTPIKNGQTDSNEKSKNITVLTRFSTDNKDLYFKEKVEKTIINNKINERSFSKNEKNIREIMTKDIGNFTNISFRSISKLKDKDKDIDQFINKYKKNYEDIFFDKNQEKKIKYIYDKDIIDKPLIINKYNFELVRVKGGIENKLFALENFTKKKFDELVEEIKNFIPIHFNTYLKD